MPDPAKSLTFYANFLKMCQEHRQIRIIRQMTPNEQSCLLNWNFGKPQLNNYCLIKRVVIDTTGVCDVTLRL